ncbi:MAG: replication-associated recombination protein A [Deltaproteobacteria bacterium]|uniref:replication-associated recombination protein A n=1 Tax=Desulfobacula sp. TaxID=2593537 RepID=UPI00198F30D4|nr:replication-associated recombination protein A [Candidatus Desulfobacula maris]MBL6993497.1 replication-associated recombination protein A [Desulfobacula sp.]
MDLFESHSFQDKSLARPLADRIRPRTLDELVGQEHLTGKGSLLQKAIEDDRVFSILLWGPPGCGKTTLAGIIAKETKSEFVEISAVLSGVKEIRQIIEQAKKNRALYKKQTILFVDEIHRFNKAQQDAFLLHVEKGLIVLVGATTQNPSFEVIPALVSRCRVFTLKSLEKKNILTILKRALIDPENGLGLEKERLSDDALEHIASVSDGDARIALTNLETAVLHFAQKKQINIQDVEIAIEKKSLLYDKAGEEHFNLISAFIKSMRGSDPDAAMYWLERMLMAGDDPYYMLRRMIRFATEDIGMADPGALTMALNASEAFRILGHPEGDDALFQAAIYLATAPKSNAVYAAHKQVKKIIQKTGYAQVPFHIRNAPTKLMKDLGYGKGYKYAHDYKDAFSSQSYLPKDLEDQRFYYPTDRGYEKTVKLRLEAWIKLKQNKQP